MSDLKSAQTGLQVSSSSHSVEVTAPPVSQPGTRLLSFNNGVLGTHSSSASELPVDDRDDGSSFSGRGLLSVYDNTHLYPNATPESTMACKLETLPLDTNTNYHGGDINLGFTASKGDELWWRTRCYMPTGWEQEANPTNGLKFFRYATENTSGVLQGYLDIYMNKRDHSKPYIHINEANTPAVAKDINVNTGSGYQMQFDTWHTFEFYVKLDDVSADNSGGGMARLWRDGVLLGEWSDEPTLRSSTDVVEKCLLFTYWNPTADGQTVPPQQNFWVDDIQITSSTPTKTDAYGNRYLGV